MNRPGKSPTHGIGTSYLFFGRVCGDTFIVACLLCKRFPGSKANLLWYIHCLFWFERFIILGTTSLRLTAQKLMAQLNCQQLARVVVVTRTSHSLVHTNPTSVCFQLPLLHTHLLHVLTVYRYTRAPSIPFSVCVSVRLDVVFQSK